MLTPAKIKNHHFDASGRNAYKAESVDAFFEEVADSYEQMFKENGEMYKKINLLAERLEEYKKDEDNIRNALLVAQRMAEKITHEAEDKANALLADAETRAKTENDRIDAVSNDLLQKATYNAKAIIEDAQQQAEKLISDATYESKAAAVSARDSMIKEEAALEMMKIEVTKFKQQILEAYNEQLALIEKLPEVVFAKFEEAKKEEEAVEETAEETVEEIKEEEPAETEEGEQETAAEEISEETSEKETAEEIFEEYTEEITEAEEDETSDEDDNNWFSEAKKAEDDIDVEQLQQLIDETEEKQPEYDEDEEDEPAEEFTADISEIIPEIEDDAEELQRVKDEIEETSTPDIMISKKNGENKGFSVNFDNITSYVDPVDDGDDVVDNFDEGNDGSNGGFASKFKGFFKK